MTLYDPFLQLYLNPADRSEAITIDAYAHNLNDALARLYRRGGFRVARVDDAFRTYDLSDSVRPNGAPVPLAVAEVCRLTWMCALLRWGPTSTPTRPATPSSHTRLPPRSRRCAEPRLQRRLHAIRAAP